jgi:hypothetical protein
MLEKVHGIVTFSPPNVGGAASFEREIEFMRVDGDFVTIIGLETLRVRSDSPASGLRAGQVTRVFPQAVCVSISVRGLHRFEPDAHEQKE